MRRNSLLILSGIALGLIGAASVMPSEDFLIWNRTESAPIGLYWRSDGPLVLNRWAVVSASSEAGIWVSSHGYAGANWPLLKRMKALHGDEVCRDDMSVFINGKPVAEALSVAPDGLKLPAWQGCHVLQADEVFLLNDHPRSLDGRYFGVMRVSALEGTARLLLGPLW